MLLKLSRKLALVTPSPVDLQQVGQQLKVCCDLMLCALFQPDV